MNMKPTQLTKKQPMRPELPTDEKKFYAGLDPKDPELRMLVRYEAATDKLTYDRWENYKCYTEEITPEHPQYAEMYESLHISYCNSLSVANARLAQWQQLTTTTVPVVLSKIQDVLAEYNADLRNTQPLTLCIKDFFFNVEFNDER